MNREGITEEDAKAIRFGAKEIYKIAKERHLMALRAIPPKIQEHTEMSLEASEQLTQIFVTTLCAYPEIRENLVEFCRIVDRYMKENDLD